MKILLTGATGFIGSNLVKHLSKSGHECYSIARPRSNIERIQKYVNKEHIFCDASNETNILNFIDKNLPEIVINLASYYNYDPDISEIRETISSNIDFPLIVAKASEILGINLFINVGSSFQFSSAGKRISNTLYAASKNTFQHLLETLMAGKSTQVTSFHLFDSYGKNDNRKKLFYLLKNSLTKDKALNMSPGMQKLNLLHVDDICRFFLKAVELYSDKFSFQPIYGVGSFETYTLKEVVKKYEKATGAALKINWGGLEYRKNEVMNPWSNFDVLPGWHQEIELESGIKIMEA